MKTIITKYILLVSLVFAASSCSLDEEPYGFYSDANFYQTDADAYAAMDYAYRALTYQENATGMFYIGECSTETTLLKPGEDTSNPGSQALDEWTVHQSQSNTTLEVYFKYLYIAINRANTVIANVENNTGLSDDVRMDITAQAYFLRAFCHFNLVRTFGLVPLRAEMITTEGQTQGPKAANMDEIYDLIIADLEKASSIFPDYSIKPGRGNKAAAEGLLAKVYLTAASSKESGVPLYGAMVASADEMYAEAATWAKKVLDASMSATFGLAPTLEEIYDVSRQDGMEHLFCVNFDRTGTSSGEYTNLLMYFTPNNGGSSYYYKSADGTLNSAYYGYEVFQTETAFYNSFDATDKRKTELMSSEIFDAAGTSIAYSPSFPFTLKYMDPLHAGEKTSARPYLLRFTDVAMIYAEAMGNDAEGWITQIRARAGLGALTAAASVADFRAQVVAERAFEFAFEGNRLYDLRRTNTVSVFVENAQLQNLTPEQEAFYPIPQRELDLNPGAR